jgi:hypothetical protein
MPTPINPTRIFPSAHYQPLCTSFAARRVGAQADTLSVVRKSADSYVVDRDAEVAIVVTVADLTQRAQSPKFDD